MLQSTPPHARRSATILGLAAFALSGFAQNAYPTMGVVDRHDPRLDELIATDAELEVLASGFTWSEGPAWDRNAQQVVFSDVPHNRIYAWSEKDGLSVFMEPSGYTGAEDRPGGKGSNGLAFDPSGRLVSCDQGDRRVAVLTHRGGKRTLTDNYAGNRFNSPNDVAVDSHHNVYFADPIYGLIGKADDPSRELPYCGVFLYRAETGETTLLTDELLMPNGVALSPDERTLYVAQSHRDAPVIMAYPINADYTLGPGKVLFDTQPLIDRLQQNHPDMPVQLPDGIKTDQSGNIWFGGPGGINVLSPDGEHLGTIRNGERMANCTFGGPDGSVLYITSDMFLCRIQTKAVGRTFAWPDPRGQGR